jgi:hypothetical protein
VLVIVGVCVKFGVGVCESNGVFVGLTVLVTVDVGVVVGLGSGGQYGSIFKICIVVKTVIYEPLTNQTSKV